MEYKLGTKFVLIAIMLVVLSTAVVGAIGFGLGRRGIETHTDLHLQSVVTLTSRRVFYAFKLQALDDRFP